MYYVYFEYEVKMPRCTAKTCSGKRCRLTGSPFCHVHTACAICLCQVEKENETLDCGHTFCRTCIFEWLIEKKTCPCCRQTVDEFTKFRAVDKALCEGKLYKVTEVRYDLSSLPPYVITPERVQTLTPFRFTATEWLEVLKIPFINVILQFIDTDQVEMYSRDPVESVYHRFVDLENDV